MPVESKPGSETEGYWRKKARERNCYCGIRDKDPDYYLERGVPDGYWSIGWIERLGSAVAAVFAGGSKFPHCPGYFVPGMAIRNFLFLLVVLAHGFRRLAPPYSGK